MYQRICWTHILVLCLAASFVSCSVQAQDAILSQYYGNGVHEFHSGDFVKAFEYLSKPINAKTEDPRPYYYRGLALIKMGRPEQAAQDFKSGAEQELKDTTGRYRIDFALERCQGPSRLTLEKTRLDARLAALQRKARMTQGLSGTGVDGSVLLDDAALTPGDFSGRLELDDTAVEGDDSGLGLDEEEPAAEPAEEPAADNGDDSGFGLDEEEPAAEPAAEEGDGLSVEDAAPEADGADPFSVETPTEKEDADPLAGSDLSVEEEPAEDTEPAAEEPAEDAEPVAEEPAEDAEPAAEEPAEDAEPAAEEPAEDAEPAAEEEDPFNF